MSDERFAAIIAADQRPFRGGGRALRAGLAAGVVGAAGVAVGFALDARQALFSWLIAYTFVLTIVIGMAAFVMACHAMNATWPTALRRIPEAATAVMPLLALFLIPVLVGLPLLYPWMHPGAIADPHTATLLRHKLPLMNRPFVVGRAVFYVVLWLLICGGLRRLSLRTDRPAAPDLTPRLRAFSALLLPALGITASWAAFDWLMSLSPDWYSTMYGFYVLAGAFLGAVALTVVLVAGAQRGGRLTGVQRAHYYALGRLLLSFVVFWGYVAYFQFFLIWIADKPIEARWYLERLQGGTRWVSAFLVFGQFLLPFFALLPYAVKQSRRALSAIAWWLLLAHYIDIHWLIAPSRGPGARTFHWLDAAALLCVAGFATALGVWRQRGHALAPAWVPSYPRALEYSSR
ncbi:MAG TPA: hypothetical protein VIF57_21905 [Polyangia bacterium]|jgi:hypothetical protein